MEKSRIGISVPMQNTFPFEAMKNTHKQRKTKIDIDELKSGTTTITHQNSLQMVLPLTHRTRTMVKSLRKESHN